MDREQAGAAQPQSARRGRRRFILDVVLLGAGLLGLTSLALASQNEKLRLAVLVLVLWQCFWYLVRLVLMVGIWRRETELSFWRKIWLALTMPLPGLAAIWAGRGALSNWLLAEEEIAS